MSAIWITGADGFVGTWLRRVLDEEGKAWAALVLPNSCAKFPPDKCLGLDLELIARQADYADSLDWDSIEPPSGLIHLAAMSFAPACEENPARAHSINVQGPRNLYQELFKRWPDCPVLHVSSGHVYRPADHHLKEDQQLEPVNVYGATKLDAEKIALEFRDRGHKLSVVRPFNHTGAGQHSAFALPSFALRMAQLERQGGGVLEVGRLDAVRDFLHVREVVNYYLQLLAKAGEVGIVNLCSGVGHSMQGLLSALRRHFECPIEIATVDSRLRGKADANRLIGDTSKLEKLLGCTPSLDLTQLCAELVADARRRVLSGEDVSRA